MLFTIHVWVTVYRGAGGSDFPKIVVNKAIILKSFFLLFIFSNSKTKLKNCVWKSRHLYFENRDRITVLCSSLFASTCTVQKQNRTFFLS